MAQLISGTTIAGHSAIHAGNLAAHSIATTSYVTTQINNLINGAPGALDTLNELAAALGNDASFSSTLTSSLAGKVSKAGDTITGKITFPSAVANRPRFPGGIVGLDVGDGNFDIWGISGDYYPSHATAANAWGLRWNGDNNDFEFVGGGTSRVILDMDGGNLTITGTISASGYNASNWNTAYGWGNHASAGYLTSLPSHNHDGRYLLLSGGTLTGDLLSTHPYYPGYNNAAVGSQGSYYLYGDTGNSGIRTNGNFLANGDIYLGTRGNWLSTYLNQNVRTDSAPSFSSVYLGGSQLTGTKVNGLSNMLGVTTLPYSVDITVDGDPDRFYAVQFWGGDQDVWRRIIIKRGYGEPAPWDPIGTGVHHGGLLLDWEGNFGGWGGAEYADRLRVFNESYTNVCADMFIYSHSMGYVFMLRGGGAVYHLFSDQPINGFYQSGSPDILYSSSTLSYDDAWSGTNQYDVPAPAPLGLAAVNSSRIDGLRTKKQSLLDGRYAAISHSHTFASLTSKPTTISGYGITDAITTGNIGSQSVSNATTAGGLAVHGGRNNEVNKIVRTDANGYIQAGWINTTSGAFSSGINKIYCSDDDYMRYQTPANFISNLGLITTGNIGSQSVTYATNSTRLYASDGSYVYGGAAPYYMYMNYDGGSYWELKVSPGTPAGVRVAYANIAGTSSQVTINYDNNSNSTYQLLWGSGNNVYGTTHVYVNPSTDVIYAKGGYISPGNPWNTADSAFFPNGISTAGADNWIYGHTYIAAAPSGGAGHEYWSDGSEFHRSNVGTASHGQSGKWITLQSATGDFIPYSFESDRGNHSWGIVARYRINTADSDRPSIQFSYGGNDTRWNVGYCSNDDNFRVTQNMGYRNNNSTSDGWGTERFKIDTSGNTYAAIGGTLYANGSAVITSANIGSQTVATAGALSSMNISQFTNNSGYLTSVTNISGNAGSVTNGVYTNITNTIVNGDATALILYGASSYSAAAALHLGGWSTDTTYARIRTSNGNLHIDTRGGAGNVYQMYFNHYSSGDMYFGNGGGTVYIYGGRLKHSDGTAYVYNSGTWSINVSGTAARATRANGNFYIDDNYGNGIVGLYASDRYQGVFAMGDAYKVSADGTSPGSLYGIAWTHTNVGGQSKSGLGHQALFMANGSTQTAIGYGIWTVGVITATGGNSTNWNTAYDKRPTAISFSGTGTKTLTLTQGDGSTLTAAFNDIDTDTNTDGQTLSLSGNTLSISGGNSVTLSSSGLSQATADNLYVNVSGDTMTGALTINSPSQGAEAFAVNGINGRLFTVVDDLSDSLYSVNTLAGLPVLEVFANNVVQIGKFGTNAIYVGQDGRVGFGTTDFSYTASDNSGATGVPTNNRLYVNGSIQLLGNNDGIVFGRGTSTYLKDEDLSFGWGGGWFMTDGTYLRVRGNKMVYSGGSARFDSNIYVGNETYYFYGDAPNAGIRTNGSFLVNGDIYFGTRGTWLSSYLNQALLTSSSPTFTDLYNNSWFRNNSNNTGLYNQANGNHFYSRGGSIWGITGNGGSVVHLQFRLNHESTLKGSVYGDAAGFGLLDSTDSWRVRVDTGGVQVYGSLTVGNSTSSDIYMTDTDETTRRIHCNSGRIGFLTSSNSWGAYADNSGNWFAANLSGTNTGDQTNISGNAATATNVAWTGVTGRPTALSQFSNDLGNYGGWAASSHTHDDRYYTETEINNFSYFRDNEDRTLRVLRFTGVGGDSGNTSNHSYAIYQGGGGWSHPYPDLHIGYHTGIKIGANTGYGGTRFYDDSTMATELFSVGNGDSHVRAANNLYAGALFDASSRVAISRGEGRNYVDYSRYVYNNGAYSGSGWIEPSDLGVRYANSAGSAPNASNQNSFYNVTPGEGNGLKLWSSDSYKISMGSSSLYQYGPVNDYSIKTQMNDGDAGRGFTWGRISYAPIAAINATSGNMQIAGTFASSNFSGSHSGSSSGTNTGDQTNIGGYSTYLATAYAGGQQTNPQVYFNNGIGLKAAMTGAWSVWSDTLWINGYSGGDVLQMCALHTLRNGTPRMAISVQASTSTSYGTFYEFITAYNIASQTVGNTNSISNSLGNGHSWTGQNYFVSNRNTSTDSAPLQAYSNNGGGAIMSFHRGGQYAVNFGLDSDNVMRIGGWSASANRWQLDMSGNMTVAGDVTAYSDARVKENVKTIENALDKTLALRGVSYNRTDSGDTKTKIGVIAQETLEVVPEVVNQDNDGMYNVSYGNMTALLIEAIKEQQAQIEDLKSEIKKLRGE
jgi:hypothetical protein